MKSSSILFILAGVVVVGLIVYVVSRPKPPSYLNGFAQCVTENGAKAYTTWWCPHCARQKEMFGNAWEFINDTDCAAGLPRGSISQTCRDNGITGVPTWEFTNRGGQRVSGVLSLEKLAEYTTCELPTEAQQAEQDQESEPDGGQDQVEVEDVQIK